MGDTGQTSEAAAECLDIRIARFQDQIRDTHRFITLVFPGNGQDLWVLAQEYEYRCLKVTSISTASPVGMDRW